MNKPTYFQAIMEEERKKREKKKMIIPEMIISLINEKKRKRKEEKEKIGKIVGATRKADKIEEPETDYYMDAGGNPQLKEKTDYFVEEIRTNIIYHNKILPILGMIARGASMVGRAGLKIGDEILSDMKEVGQGAMQGIGDEAEEEEE